MRYGTATIRDFIREWFDYSERKMAHAIAGMPAGTVVGHGRHDPIGDVLPDGIPLTVKIAVDPVATQRDNSCLRISQKCFVDAGDREIGATLDGTTTGHKTQMRSPRLIDNQRNATSVSRACERRDIAQGPAIRG